MPDSESPLIFSDLPPHPPEGLMHPGWSWTPAPPGSPPKCWDYRSTSPHSALSDLHFFKQHWLCFISNSSPPACLENSIRSRMKRGGQVKLCCRKMWNAQERIFSNNIPVALLKPINILERWETARRKIKYRKSRQHNRVQSYGC